MLTLRPYQNKALDDLWTWFAAHGDGHPILEAAVGAGKSLLIAAIAQRVNAEAPGTRVLVLVHQKELLDQNVEKIRAIWPGADVGIFSASHGRKDVNNQIIFATIGSVHRHAAKMGNIGLVMADECHLIQTKEQGTWRKFLTELFGYCPHARIVGMTGTPYRGNGVWLTAGDAPLFTHIGAKVTMRQLLDEGFLAPLVPATTHARIYTDGVGTQNGDYIVGELARVTDTPSLVNDTCDEIVKLGASRKSWLVFCVTVEHAEHVKDALRTRGINAALVTGETPKAERATLLAAYKSGRIRALVNVAVLTTGFDAPQTDFIAMLRATKSPVLYVQIMGRGMRLADGKADCMVADFTETVAELGPVDAIKGRLPSQKGSGEAPFKLCPDCGSRNAASATHCTSCGFEFPPPERVKHGSRASSAAILSTQVVVPETIWHDITRVAYNIHSKPGKPDCLRVDYWSGIRQVASEWVHFDRDGWPRTNALSWYARRKPVGYLITPTDTEQLMEWIDADDDFELKAPTRIATRKNGKFTEVTSYEFNPTHHHERSPAQVAA